MRQSGPRRCKKGTRPWRPRTSTPLGLWSAHRRSLRMQAMARSAVTRGACAVGAEATVCSAREAHAAAPVRCRACTRAEGGGVARTGVASSASVPMRISRLAVVEYRGRVRGGGVSPAVERLICAPWRWCECDGIECSAEACAGRGR